MQQAKGFSLIELVFVMIIIGILAGVALPKIFKTLDFSENFYFNDLLASVRYAQKLAIVSGCDTQVLLTGQVFSLKRRTNCTSGAFSEDIRNPQRGQSLFIKTLPEDISLSASLSDFYFDPLGRAHRTNTGAVSNIILSINTRSFQVVGETGLTYEPDV